MLYVYNGKYPKWIKLTPNFTGKNIGAVKNGDILSVDKTTPDGWLVLKKGFVYKYEKNGSSLFSNDIKDFHKADVAKTKSIKERFTAYDDDSEDEPAWANYDFYPEDNVKYTDNGVATSIQNLGDGKYQKTVINGSNTTIEIYSKDGTISTQTQTPGKYGSMDITTVYADGSKDVKTGVVNEGFDSKYEVVQRYDANGNIVDTIKTDYTQANGALSNDQAAQSIGMALSDTAYNGSRFSGNLNIQISDIYAIHGMPYQFMDIVDRPADGKNFGRVYADRVVARMPLLIMCPGEPQFLAGWSDEDRESVWNQILHQVEAGSTIENITQRQGRYYVFEERWDVYCKYLDPLCQSAAFFLGIGGEQGPGGNGPLSTYEWGKFRNEDVAGKLNYRHSAAFYIHSDTQISDDMSNSTTRSSLADKVNSFSDMAKEVQFLTGAAGATMNMEVANDVANGMHNQENIEKFTEDVLSKGSFLERIGQNLATIVQGGKLIFPEIWSDSQFSKDYSVTIKLRCPNPDPLSWYFNIWVPIAHILPYVLPKQAGPNGYVAPFLVRAFFKGLFNCQMGLVTNISITRGNMNEWTLDGLPSSVDVNISIKDLYSILSVTKAGSSQFEIMNNIGLLDYIANICGVNINEPDLKRMLTMYYYQKTNAVRRLPGDLNNTLDQWATNLISNAWRNRL